jgi:hypothetical protein
MPPPRLVLCARPGIDKGKPGVTRGRKATGLGVTPIQFAGLPEVLYMTYWDGERWLDERVQEPRQASRARRVFDHSWKALLEGVLISLLVVGLIAGTAFAGRGGKTAVTAHGSCQAASSPVAVGTMYTVLGSGFKPGEMITVWVSDSHGTQTLFPPVDGSGNFSASSWASWTGSYSASVYNNGGRKMVWLTSCSFTVE